jgi:hypothetical protein
MPAPVYGLTRDFYSYKSDDTNNYTVATTDGNAAAQTAPPSPINPGSLAAYPRGWRMRKVYGAVVVSGVLYRTHIPILDPTDILWTGAGTTFVKGGSTFVVEGRIGETREYKGG